MTTARVVSLVLSGVRIVTPDLSLGAGFLLARLCEYVFDAARWASGDLIVTPGNATLAASLGVAPRHVSRLLGELEAAGWIIRRYNRANRRCLSAGLDLRPVAARVEHLRQAVAAVKAELASRYAEAEDSAESEEADAAGYPQTDLSGRDDGSVTLKYLTKKSKQDSVQAFRGVQTLPGADDSQLVGLMVLASPTLQRVLSPTDQIALSSPDTASVALGALTRAVSWLVRQELALQGSVWASALRKHGITALAAAVVAIERHGVRNRAAYLRGMLGREGLRLTVRHSLGALSLSAGERAQ
ncbi:helix-turn-helix domain-containing protein [Novispirillum itersonii]